MRMAIPLTSKAKKLKVVIQCVMRTTAECLGESDAFKPWTASPSRYVDSGIESGAIITHQILLAGSGAVESKPFPVPKMSQKPEQRRYYARTNKFAVELQD